MIRSPRGLRAFGVLTAVLLSASAHADDPPLLAPLRGNQALELPAVAGSIPSPAAFLGYPLGERFTPHHRIVDYLETLAEASERLVLESYGETYEGRPLLTAIISSAATLRELDSIRSRRPLLGAPEELDKADRRRLAANNPAVLWLGYGVHGNELSSAEAAMATAYLLAAATRDALPSLDRLIIVIDPLVNPDGHERYLAAFRSRRGMNPDPYHAAREHQEQWPTGRYNHYLFDLNRDWAWATQQETRHRLATFQSWEPQIAIDFHEMGPDRTYFFPPPAEPVHPAVGAPARRWLEIFGRADAKTFDDLGWTYSMGESYDLFYPAYGDSYTTLRGAVGMTYETAGGGRAGSALLLANGRPLTLADRIARHLTASIASVRTAAHHAGKLVEDFVSFRFDTSQGPGASYLWTDDQPEAAALVDLLERHGIRVGRLAEGLELRARPLVGGAAVDTSFAAGTWIVGTAQPLGRLVTVLLERQAEMPEAFLARQRQRVDANLEPEFFDVTAWSLPLALNLDAWVVDEAHPAQVSGPRRETGLVGEPRAGFVVTPQGLRGYRFAAALQASAEPFLLALDQLELSGRTYPRGSLFVPRRPGDGDQIVRLAELAARTGITLDGAATSRSVSDTQLGSDRMLTIGPSRIGLFAGPGVSPPGLGALWYTLDRMVGARHSMLELETFRSLRLADFDVLVLPPGRSYDSAIGDDGAKRLRAWITDGGTLIAVGSALEWLAKHDLTKLEPQPGNAVGTSFEPLLETPGAVAATRMGDHALTAGLGTAPFVLVSGSRFYRPLGDPQMNLLTVRAEKPIVAGFAWPEAVERIAGAALLTVEPLGSGRVVAFPQHPAFRAFWRGTMPLFLNAVMYGPSL